MRPPTPKALWSLGSYSLFPVPCSPTPALTEVLFSKTLSMMMIVLKVAGLPLMRPLHRSAAELRKAVLGDG